MKKAISSKLILDERKEHKKLGGNIRESEMVVGNKESLEFCPGTEGNSENYVAIVQKRVRRNEI